MFYLLATFAQFERSLIAERVKAGMDRARKRGKHVGRPPALNGNLDTLRPRIEAGVLSRCEAARQLHVSVSTISRAVRNQPTATG